MSYLIFLVIFSAASFLVYGYLCLTSPFMKEEFKRYQLPEFRVFVAYLELLGGAGLIVGLKWSFFLHFSAAGLGLLMLAGVAVRIKIKDGLLQSLPAMVFMLINFYIFAASLDLLNFK